MVRKRWFHKHAEETRMQKSRRPRLPNNLKTAHDVAHRVHLTVSRLTKLAELGYVPHYTVDGGPPLFLIGELQRWILDNLVTRESGTRLRLTVLHTHKKASVADTPTSLSLVTPLFRVTDVSKPCGSGIYFLCLEDSVVYVGQSEKILQRAITHLNGKEFDRILYIPIPDDGQDLMSIEGAFIRTLKPKYNHDKNGKLISQHKFGRDAEILKPYHTGGPACQSKIN